MIHNDHINEAADNNNACLYMTIYYIDIIMNTNNYLLISYNVF